MAILELSQTHRLYPVLQNVLFSLSLNDFGCLGHGAQHSVLLHNRDQLAFQDGPLGPSRTPLIVFLHLLKRPSVVIGEG